MPSIEPVSSVAILSDCHVSIESGSPDFIRLCNTMSMLLDHVEHVVLLGDVFQVWTAVPPFDHDNGRALLNLIDRKGPGRVSLVEGNWDFYLASRYAHHFAHCSERSIVLDVQGRKTAFVHGHQFTGFQDGLLVRILKWPPVRWMFRHGWLNGAAKRLNRSFQDGAYSVKMAPEMLSAVCKHLTRAFSRADRIFCGHFHTAVQCDRIRILPDHHRTGAFWMSAPTAGLYRMENGNPVPAADIDWRSVPFSR